MTHKPEESLSNIYYERSRWEEQARYVGISENDIKQTPTDQLVKIVSIKMMEK